MRGYVRSPLRIWCKKMEKIRESEIEKYLVDKVKDIGGLCMKWVSPGNSGVPDRIVIFDKGVYFIELKRPGESPRALQVETIRRLQRQDMIAFVIDEKLKIDKFIKMIDLIDYDTLRDTYTEHYGYDDVGEMYEMFERRGYLNE